MPHEEAPVASSGSHTSSATCPQPMARALETPQIWATTTSAPLNRMLATAHRRTLPTPNKAVRPPEPLTQGTAPPLCNYPRPRPPPRPRPSASQSRPHRGAPHSACARPGPPPAGRSTARRARPSRARGRACARRAACTSRRAGARTRGRPSARCRAAVPRAGRAEGRRGSRSWLCT